MRLSHPDLFVLPQLPTVLGDRYELTRRIGIGGSAEVFLAWDRDLAREVAVKRLRGERQGDVLATARLRDEAKLLAAARTDPMTEIFDIQTTASECFLVLRHIAGRALDRVLEHGPLFAPAALQIASDVVCALLDQHARGLVHQAVTPANILVDDTGHALLLDLGDVHECGACRDEAGDIDGVGRLVLHAMIAAPLPEDRRTLADLARRMLPADVARVIARAVAPRGERYARLVDLATALRAALASPDDTIPTATPIVDTLDAQATTAIAPLARGSAHHIAVAPSVLAPAVARPRARPRTTRGRWQMLAMTGAVAIVAATSAAGTSAWLAADASMAAAASTTARLSPQLEPAEIDFEPTSDDIARAAARHPVRVITIPPRAVR